MWLVANVLNGKDWVAQASSSPVHILTVLMSCPFSWPLVFRPGVGHEQREDVTPNLGRLVL